MQPTRTDRIAEFRYTLDIEGLSSGEVGRIDFHSLSLSGFALFIYQ